MRIFYRVVPVERESTLWKVVGWIIGVSIYGGIFFALTYFGDALDLPTYRSGASRRVTNLSFYGLMSTGLGGVLGTWAGMAVYRQCLWGGGDRAVRLGLLCTVVALVAMVVMAMATHLIFRDFAAIGPGPFRLF